MRFDGNLAVITGGADGMGRCLAMQLISQGCSLALCDLNPQKLEEMKKECERIARDGATVSTHLCDVSNEGQVLKFAEEVAASHPTAQARGILLFNNAGLGGGGSIIRDSRAAWEKCFNVCWGGVYLTTRAFLPMLLQAREGYVVNTSSTCGYFPPAQFLQPNTSYAAAKFAVKGFSEALIEDFRLHAPHIKVACVMPGCVTSNIGANSGSVMQQVKQETQGTPMGAEPKEMGPRGAKIIARFAELKAEGHPLALGLDKAGLAEFYEKREEGGGGPTMQSRATPAEQARQDATLFLPQTRPWTAASNILEGIRNDKWRIFASPDAKLLDEIVRAHPEEIYEDGSLTAFFTGQCMVRDGSAVGPAIPNDPRSRL